MRSFKSGIPEKDLVTLLKATMEYEYKGIKCHKNPFDLAIYKQLIWDSKPKSLIEIGSKYGGSAIYFEDLCRSYQLNTTIVSIDLNPPFLAESSVSFLQGDVLALASVFDQNDLFQLPRPWLIIEDSAHTLEACYSTLEFASEHLRTGEYLVIEDGILDELGWSEKYNGGPNLALTTFFKENPDVFRVATDYCDMFGTNMTFNPNGYLQKT